MPIDLRNLAASEDRLRAIATKVFHDITSIPAEVRGDTKERTGICVLVGQPDSRNFVLFSIGEPPDASKFFCPEKAARASVLGDCSSGNSRDPSRCRYAGCVAVLALNKADDRIILLQCSISGLQEHEDVAASILTLSRFLGIATKATCQWVQGNGGVLPEELFQEGHYLNNLLFPRP